MSENKEAIKKVTGRSLGYNAMLRLKKNKGAMAALFILGFLITVSLIGPFFTKYQLDEVNWDYIQGPPSFEKGYLFGTDQLGRDLLVRTLYGIRISLSVGLLATFVSILIGAAYGATAAYLGGKTDYFMMRLVDSLYAVPFIFFVIILMVLFGRNFVLIFVAIGCIEWLTMSRIVRGQTMSILKKEFIEAARAVGTPGFKILTRHVLPNILGTMIVYSTMLIPQIIILESFLSFLGLGVQEPLTSLGVLISDGTDGMEGSPWLIAFPGVTLAILLLSLNYLGDGLRDALDPKDRV